MTTIADLLSGDTGTAPLAIGARLSQLDIVASLPKPLAAFDDLTRQLETAITAFLRTPVHELIFTAWDKLVSIQDACRETREKPGAFTTVSVYKQTLTTTQRPAIDIAAGGTHYRALELVVTLVLDIETIPVTVWEGRIVRIGVGHAGSTASLGIATKPSGQPHPLASKTLDHVVLPSWDIPVGRASTVSLTAV